MLKKFFSLLLKLVYFVPFFLVIVYSVKTRLSIPPVAVDIYDEYQSLLISKLENRPLDMGMVGPYYQFFIYFFTYATNSFSGIIYFNFILVILELILLALIFWHIKKYYLGKNSRVEKGIFYILSILFLFIFLNASDKVTFEYRMRPENFSQFLEVLFVFLFLKFFQKNSKKSFYSRTIIILSIFAILFQNKFLFLSIFNILLILFFCLKNKFNQKKIKVIFSFIILPIILTVGLNTFITKRINQIIFNRTLYTSIAFWRKGKIVNGYIVRDFNNPDFQKFDKRKLKDIIDVYQRNKEKYESLGEIKTEELDFITYFDMPYAKYPNDYELEEINRIYIHYLLKSAILSPRDYIEDYLNEMRRVFGKYGKFIIKLSNPYIDSNEYQETKLWSSKRYINLDNVVIKNYIDELENCHNNFKELKRDIVLTKLNYYIYFYFKPLVFIFLTISLLHLYKRESTVFRLKRITLYSILAPLLFYSVTAATFTFTERYTSEVFPLFLFCLFFVILSNLFWLVEILKSFIAIFERK